MACNTKELETAYIEMVDNYHWKQHVPETAYTENCM